MTELAIDADGEPFELPDHVVGWRVRRMQPDGRGRPELVYDAAGKPLQLPLSAGFADVLKAAGPGKYRLDPVDHRGKADDKLPTGVTGYMQPADGAGAANDNGCGASLGTKPGSTAQLSEMAQLLAMVVQQNTQMANNAVTTMANQLASIMTATSQLIAAADGASITTRLPPPPPPPAPVVEVEYEQPVPAQPGWVDALGAMIVQAAPTLVPMLLSKLPGLPLASLLDWRKAVPSQTVAPTPPIAPAAPVATAASPAANTNAAPTRESAPASAATTTSAHAAASHVVSGTPTTPAPSATTAPDSSAAARAPEQPEPTAEQLQAAVNAHMTLIWSSLTPAEQARGAQLITFLKPDERTAWIAELSALTVPEALERVRYVIRPNEAPSAPTTKNGGAS